MGTADLKDAFYHLSLPLPLRDYFCLGPVRAECVGVSEVNGAAVSKKRLLTPRVAVVPMGWSWALFLCQKIHESLADGAGLDNNSRVRDKHPPPPTGCCHTQYVDNMIVLGTDHEKVRALHTKATNALKGSGLQVHEEEVTFGAKILGWEITADGIFRPSRQRAWKVRMALRGLLRRGRCSAHLLKKVIGHCSFLCLGCRECFSILGEVYTFIRRHYKHSLEVPIPKSVRRELVNFDGVIPLIRGSVVNNSTCSRCVGMGVGGN